MRSIHVIVGPSGEIVIEAVSFKGPDCEKATQYLELALGVEGRRVRKPEHSRTNTINPQQKVGS